MWNGRGGELYTVTGWTDCKGTDGEFRKMLSRAAQDETIARPVPRRMTHKRRMTCKRPPTTEENSSCEQLVLADCECEIPKKRKSWRAVTRRRWICTAATWQACKSRASKVRSRANKERLWPARVEQMVTGQLGGEA